MRIPEARHPAIRLFLIAMAMMLAYFPASATFAKSLDPAASEAPAVDPAAAAATATEQPVVTEAPVATTDAAVTATATESVTTAATEAAATDAAAADAAQAQPDSTGAATANQSGPYDSTTDGSPSQNGSGSGGGRPCAGCVGNADDKNPPGQLPSGAADGNNGYECDGNSGVGRTNPAHSGCRVVVPPNPKIALDKTGPANSTIGATYNYTFKVTNTGNVPLSNVHLTDPLLGSGTIRTFTGTLAVDASWDFTVPYTVRAQDVVNNRVPNTATAKGTSPTGVNVQAQDSWIVNLPSSFNNPNPRIDLDKSGPSTASPGDVITYTFAVRNTGEVTLTNVRITDPLLIATTLAVTPSTLAPGASGTATATYTVTQAHAQAGKILNTATVHGTPPTGPDVLDTDDHTVTVPLTPGNPRPALLLEKTGPATAAEGDEITYRFRVTNTGDVTLTDVSITDPTLDLAGLPVRPSTLAPGQSGTASATYRVTRADARRGFIHNTAVAEGIAPGGGRVSDEDDHTTEVVPPPVVPPGPPPVTPPAPPPVVPPAPPAPPLPATGSDAPAQLLAGLMALFVGALLIKVSNATQAAVAGLEMLGGATRLAGYESPPPVHRRRH